jgi:hypothetical protein
MNASNELARIEWHDLPIAELAIGESGLRLHITPYNDADAKYDVFDLYLHDFSEMEFDIIGAVSARDVTGLEINSFKFDEQAGRISGRLVLLSGQRCWVVKFRDSRWRIEKPPKAAASNMVG